MGGEGTSRDEDRRSSSVQFHKGEGTTEVMGMVLGTRGAKMTSTRAYLWDDDNLIKSRSENRVRTANVY